MNRQIDDSILDTGEKLLSQALLGEFRPTHCIAPQHITQGYIPYEPKPNDIMIISCNVSKKKKEKIFFFVIRIWKV